MPRRPLVLIVLALAIVGALAADLSYREHVRPRFAVAVEGRVLGALRQPEVANQVLADLKAEITPDMELHVDLTEKLVIRPLTDEERYALVGPELIRVALAGTIPDLANAYALSVNGQDIVAVADQEAAKAVVDTMMAEYKQTILRDASSVEQLKFRETIAWRPKLVKHENVRTVEEAMNILKHGTDKLVTYVVRRGDTGWDIARSYNVTTEQLAKANPDTDLERLQIGQVLNVTFREPYVHTQSVSKKVVRESIPFTEDVIPDADLWPWQYEVDTPGKPGVRELTVREYREDGRIVRTEVLENKVVTAPKKQITRHGTRQIPEMGTGSLVYPVAGVTTSYFGPRWGSFHYGLDIGAPVGTPILAADSGMVVFRGWSGNYGNLIQIDHGGGKMVTWYAHLSRFNVTLGQEVKKGDVIGYVGSTGFSDGPHLHYEVHVDGDAVNPLKFYQ